MRTMPRARTNRPPARALSARARALTAGARARQDVRLRRPQRPPAANLTTQPGADYPYRQPRPVLSRRQPAGRAYFLPPPKFPISTDFQY
eukprot:COSAG03_NODE_136_length_11848_cov_31.778960_3_plen_90_part_00